MRLCDYRSSFSPRSHIYFLFLSYDLKDGVAGAYWAFMAVIEYFVEDSGERQAEQDEGGTAEAHEVYTPDERKRRNEGSAALSASSAEVSF